MPDQATPSTPVTASLSRRQNRLVVVYASLAAALVLSISAWSLASAYQRAIEDAESQTSNYARAFATHASRTVGEVFRVIDGLARRLNDPAIVNQQNEQALHLRMKEYLAGVPQITSVVLIDMNGMSITSSTVSGYKIDYSDRLYFHRHQADPSLEINIDDPVIGRLSNKPIVVVSRRLSSPTGEFIGVISTGLSQKYFTDFYASVSLGAGGLIALTKNDGGIVAQIPASNELVDKTIATRDGMRTSARDRVDIFRMQSPDGVERIVSVAAVENYPLKVQVAMSLPHVLAPWYARLFWFVAATGFALVGLFAFAIVLFKQQKRLAETEASKQHNTEILNKTILGMADGMIVADKDRKVLVCNPAAEKLFGLRNGDTLSLKRGVIYELLHADDSTPFRPDQIPIERAIRGESVDDVDQIVRRKDIEMVRRLKVNARPIIDDHGQVRGGVSIYHDVTDVIETERQLLHAQKMDAVGQLTGGVAHDFNNILTIILGNLDILADALASDARLLRILHMIDQAAERGAELTQRLLAFARKQPLQPCKVVLNELVGKTEQLLRHVLGEHIEIVTALEPDLWPAMVDRSQIETALINLALNARDAMPDGGKLTIETAKVVLDEQYAASHSEVRAGPYAMIAITDTGTGIPEAIRQKVFEPFFTTKQTGKGTGLGLSMVYGFVKQSGGHIKIYSEVGHGTSVKIYLPRADAAEIFLEEAAALVPELAGIETVLVVEDDPLVRDNACGHLASLGYKIIQAADANAGLGVLRDRDDIDLLFTDVILPGGMSGRELAEAACKLKPSLKVLFTSGYTENAIIHQGRLDRGVLLLAKPYRRAELGRMVRLALANVRNGLALTH
ncbi:MAG: ATP-binding protein [Xanthobacteraceae bacterium]|nr:ATP-binding protein [Xanthobacteraceae bacterium]